MKKTKDQSIRHLQNRIFWVIWIIISIFIVLQVGLFVRQTYVRELKMTDQRVLPPPHFHEAMQHNQPSLVELAVISMIFEILAALIARVLARYATKPIERVFLSQQRFIADASHELKTPLAVITSSADMLENKIPTPNNKWLVNIQNESNHMTEMVKQLLDLTASERSEDYILTEDDLSREVLTAALPFEGLAYEKSLKLKVAVTPELKCNFDPVKIRQLVSILLDNAIEHASSHTTIDLNLAAEKNKIILKIKNRGKAISENDAEKIFERFYRADKSRSRKTGHYGLGLAIAKNIVTAHDGTISAHSERGWTEFVVILPKL